MLMLAFLPGRFSARSDHIAELVDELPFLAFMAVLPVLLLDTVIRAERLDKSYAVRDNFNTRYASSRNESYGEEWILIWRPRPMQSTSRSF